MLRAIGKCAQVQGMKPSRLKTEGTRIRALSPLRKFGQEMQICHIPCYSECKDC